MFEEQIAALNGIYDTLVTIPSIITGLALAVLLAVLYPVVVLISVFEYMLNFVFAHVIDLVNSIITIPNILIDMINVLFVGVFPSDWLTVFSILVLLAAGKSVYLYLRDIEILGCKI